MEYQTAMCPRRAIVTAFLVFAPVSSTPAFAQDPWLDVSAGWVGFADDGVVSESMVGGAGRFYLTPRIAVGPELLYISGENHSHTVLTGNLTFDVIAPAAGRPARITPFLVVGGGVFQTRESFFGEDVTHTEGAFTAGGGVRAAAGDRVSVGVDVRLGWETHLRVNGTIGVRLGR
jgi:hypothetical protein